MGSPTEARKFNVCLQRKNNLDSVVLSVPAPLYTVEIVMLSDFEQNDKKYDFEVLLYCTQVRKPGFCYLECHDLLSLGIKCYRCKANLHYQGGGWRNETNADCDGKRKYVMDEKYRNPDECAMGEWCSMSLTHKVAASGWKDLYRTLSIFNLLYMIMRRQSSNAPASKFTARYSCFRSRTGTRMHWPSTSCYIRPRLLQSNCEFR